MKPKIIFAILFLVCDVGLTQNLPLEFSLLRQNDNVGIIKQFRRLSI